jgi:hypothetical protein
VDDAERNYRLIVTVEPEVAPQTRKPLDEWPPGFIDRTYGGWQGELERAPQEFLSDKSIEETAGKWVGELERQPQGDYEKRIAFDDP